MTRKEEITKAMMELFRGRGNSYAIKILKGDGGKLFIPHRDPETGKDFLLSEHVMNDHLSGKNSIGVYTVDTNDTVNWAAVDFDGKRGDPLKDAIVVKRVFAERLGVISWLERSQSGKGIHLWVFFEHPIPARIVRKVLGTCIPEFNERSERKTSFDRLFPVQDSTNGAYGNLCALPLNGPDLVKQGRTAFITETGESILKQGDLVLEMRASRNDITVLREAADNLPVLKTYKASKMPTAQQIPGGTKLLCPQGCAWLRSCKERSKTLGYDEWYAALTQFAKVEDGELLAHRFSEDNEGYSAEGTTRQFEQAKKADKALLCTTIWEKFGDCGKRCEPLGVKAPWQLAKVPLGKLDSGNKGKVYDGPEIARMSIDLAREIAEGKKVGFSWGYDVLDDATELRPGNLIIVAARRSIGKTAWAVDVASLGAQRQTPHLIFSIEMSVIELGMRFLANISGIDHTLITTGKLNDSQWIEVIKAKDKLDKMPLFIDDSTRDLDRMLDNAGEFVYKYGKGPIWIDYLQLVKKGQNESKKEAVDRAIDAYKQMAKILEVPVIALAQLNRSEEMSESDVDLDQWLKDSGDIEQTADVILYIRGNRGPGTIARKISLHKDRSREGGLVFSFNLQQNIFKFSSARKWEPQDETDANILFNLQAHPDKLDL